MMQSQTICDCKNTKKILNNFQKYIRVHINIIAKSREVCGRIIIWAKITHRFKFGLFCCLHENSYIFFKSDYFKTIILYLQNYVSGFNMLWGAFNSRHLAKTVLIHIKHILILKHEIPHKNPLSNVYKSSCWH